MPQLIRIVRYMGPSLPYTRSIARNQGKRSPLLSMSQPYHCGTGVSRLTGFAIAALKEKEGPSLLATTHEVRQLYSNGLPHVIR